jgi:hypothetical protein
MEIILTYAALYGPALVSILGIATTILVAINRFREEAAKLKTNEVITTQQEMATNLKTLVDQNRDLSTANKYLVDQLTKINGYVDAKEKEKK